MNSKAKSPGTTERNICTYLERKPVTRLSISKGPHSSLRNTTGASVPCWCTQTPVRFGEHSPLLVWVA